MSTNNEFYCQEHCIHYPACLWNGEYKPTPCRHFKDKAYMVELPCKVGQTIYALWSRGRSDKGIAEFEIRHINLDTPENTEIVYRSKKLNATMARYAKASDFGKTLFLTREEAEKALERSENGT